MPSLLQRARRGISAGLRAARGAPDFKTLEMQIDNLTSNGLVEEIHADAPIEEKALPKRKSLLDIRKQGTDLAYASMFGFVSDLARKKDEIPQHGDIDRDHYLSCIWQSEPILAGAVYSMSAKMSSLSWQVTGRRNLAMYYAKLFSRAAYMGGYGWGGFQPSSAQDFYTTDRGVFWESPRRGSRITGRVADIGHIDSLACTLTGNVKYPVQYVSDVTGQNIRFRSGEFIHFTSLPSPREIHLGIGFCAVSRALRAAQLLMGLHNYDAEKLANLPPEGVAAVTGLTMQEFQDALKLWRIEREKNKSLTFPQVLWLLGSQPNSTVAVEFTGFSQTPESFDRETVVTQYVNTLALDFGVDAREFWPISTSSLGTAAESEIQHMKAKGKGPGEYITLTERLLNYELEEGIEFRYDTQDIEEDMNAAAVAKGWVDAFFPLTTAGGAAEEVISKDQFMRLLADKGVVPDWMVDDKRVMIEDAEVHQREFSSDNDICIEWDGGVIKQVRMPEYRMRTVEATAIDAITVPMLAEPLNGRAFKGGAGSGHRGHSGRPGKRGGSAAGSGGGMSGEQADDMWTDNYWSDAIKAVSAGGTVEEGLGEGSSMESYTDEEVRQAAVLLQKRASSERVSETTLYRGDTRFPGEAEEEFVVGNVVELEGLTAASWTEGTAHLYADVETIGGEGAGIIYTIRDSRGVQGTYVHSADDEVLLPHGARYVVSDVRRTEDDVGEFFHVTLSPERVEEKEEPPRNIRGKPIPEGEALRGAKVTQRTIDAEVELWRSDPVLSQYVTEEGKIVFPQE